MLIHAPEVHAHSDSLVLDFESIGFAQSELQLQRQRTKLTTQRLSARVAETGAACLDFEAVIADVYDSIERRSLPQIGQRSAADDRDREIRARRQRFDARANVRAENSIAGLWNDVRNRAVEIEKQRDFRFGAEALLDFLQA